MRPYQSVWITPGVPTCKKRTFNLLHRCSRIAYNYLIHIVLCLLPIAVREDTSKQLAVNRTCKNCTL
jgi:hypothetical protein